MCITQHPVIKRLWTNHRKTVKSNQNSVSSVVFHNICAWVTLFFAKLSGVKRCAVGQHISFAFVITKPPNHFTKPSYDAHKYPQTMFESPNYRYKFRRIFTVATAIRAKKLCIAIHTSMLLLSVFLRHSICLTVYILRLKTFVFSLLSLCVLFYAPHCITFKGGKWLRSINIQNIVAFISEFCDSRSAPLEKWMTIQATNNHRIIIQLLWNGEKEWRKKRPNIYSYFHLHLNAVLTMIKRQTKYVCHHSTLLMFTVVWWIMNLVMRRIMTCEIK